MLNAFFLPDVVAMRHQAALMAYAFIGLGMFFISSRAPQPLLNLQYWLETRSGHVFCVIFAKILVRSHWRKTDHAFARSKFWGDGTPSLCFFIRLPQCLMFSLFSFFQLRQNVAFFDSEENQPRLMGAKLSNEASQVRSTAGENLGMTLQTMTMLLTGVILAFIYGWQLALVVLGVGPLIGLAGVLQFKFIAGFSADSKNAIEKSSQIATEALGGIRTLSAFAAEQRVLERFQVPIRALLVSVPSYMMIHPS